MPSAARVLALLALVLSVGLLAGCASGGSTPGGGAANPDLGLPTPLPPRLTPVPEAAASLPTSTSTPTPTRTPTPKPPTPTATATRQTSEASALLKQVQSKQQDVKSARGLMEIAVEGQQAGVPQSITMLFEFEMAEPDMHMKMSTKGMPFSLNMEMITKGDTAYMKMDDEWVSMPGAAKTQTKSQMQPLDVDDLESFLADATNVQLIGRRSVKGVECDVISFKLSPQKIQELAALRGQSSAQRTPSDAVQLDQFHGEVAVGVADKLVRQMVFKMSGTDKRKPAERFDMTFTISMWDINSPSIVIKAPEGAKPLGASPTPVRRTPTPVKQI